MLLLVRKSKTWGLIDVLRAKCSLFIIIRQHKKAYITDCFVLLQDKCRRIFYSTTKFGEKICGFYLHALKIAGKYY